VPDDDSNYLGQGDLGAKMMGKLPGYGSFNQENE